jgi:hypothetical protein
MWLLQTGSPTSDWLRTHSAVKRAHLGRSGIATYSALAASLRISERNRPRDLVIHGNSALWYFERKFEKQEGTVFDYKMFAVGSDMNSHIFFLGDSIIRPF